MKNKFKVKAKIWIWKGDAPAAWHFVTIPPEISEVISIKFHAQKRGWGSLPVLVELELDKEARATPVPPAKLRKKKNDFVVNKNRLTFETSIFPQKKDTPHLTYLLPLKKTVRDRLGVQDGEVIDFNLQVKPKG
jgi:hypothetical protein